MCISIVFTGASPKKKKKGSKSKRRSNESGRAQSSDRTSDPRMSSEGPVAGVNGIVTSADREGEETSEGE